MMKVEPIELDGNTAIAIEVKLPKTTLLVVTTDKGYIMCGALDVPLRRYRLFSGGIMHDKGGQALLGLSHYTFVYLYVS
ncbi:hypothetical protein KV564_09865 [Paenibacillus chitinolyticus]|nr:hypothetical protein [Paenibacillus chitinolyticus]MBV6713959.1 hypothetical protein [Paenibacillus chitinolyticus]